MVSSNLQRSTAIALLLALQSPVILADGSNRLRTREHSPIGDSTAINAYTNSSTTTNTPATTNSTTKSVAQATTTIQPPSTILSTSNSTTTTTESTTATNVTTSPPSMLPSKAPSMAPSQVPTSSSLPSSRPSVSTEPSTLPSSFPSSKPSSSPVPTQFTGTMLESVASTVVDHAGDEEPLYTGPLVTRFEYAIHNSVHEPESDNSWMAILAETTTEFVKDVVGRTFDQVDPNLRRLDQIWESNFGSRDNTQSKMRGVRYGQQPSVGGGDSKRTLRNPESLHRQLSVRLLHNAVSIETIEEVQCSSQNLGTQSSCQKVTVKTDLYLVNEPQNATAVKYQNSINRALIDPGISFPNGVTYAGPSSLMSKNTEGLEFASQSVNLPASTTSPDQEESGGAPGWIAPVCITAIGSVVFILLARNQGKKNKRNSDEYKGYVGIRRPALKRDLEAGHRIKEDSSNKAELNRGGSQVSSLSSTSSSPEDISHNLPSDQLKQKDREAMQRRWENLSLPTLHEVDEEKLSYSERLEVSCTDKEAEEKIEGSSTTDFSMPASGSKNHRSSSALSDSMALSTPDASISISASTNAVDEEDEALMLRMERGNDEKMKTSGTTSSVTKQDRDGVTDAESKKQAESVTAAAAPALFSSQSSLEDFNESHSSSSSLRSDDNKQIKDDGRNTKESKREPQDPNTLNPDDYEYVSLEFVNTVEAMKKSGLFPSEDILEFINKVEALFYKRNS